MSLFSNISILIPYLCDSEYTKKIFRWTYTRLKIFFPDAEFNIGISYDLSSFNRSRMINTLAEKASKDILLIVDPSVAFDMYTAIYSLNLMDSANLITPYSFVHALDLTSTERLLSESETIILRDSPYKLKKATDYSMGTFLFVKKSIFEKSGGFDEEITEWGYDKDYFAEMIDLSYGNTITLDGLSVWNLWDNKNCLISIGNTINLPLLLN